jgi:uncharacterized protein (TIGR02265 family)
MKLVYAHTVEGLFWRALDKQVTPPLKAELFELGLDLEAAPKDVSQEQWAKILAAAVKHLYPRLSTDDGFYRLGETLMQGYESTIMGKALFAMMRLLGPHRVIKRLTSQLRSGNTYSEGTAKETGPNRYEVWTNECNGNPGYLRAVLYGGLYRAGAKNLQVKILSFDGHAATFDVSWA